jgi:thiol:disulfide interchange protein DsbC
MSISIRFLATCALCITASMAFAQEAVIRKNLAERYPNFPKIDEVVKAPVPGLFEVRVDGTEIFYTDAEANYLIQGSIIDTKIKRNLTEERVSRLQEIDFDKLPLKDAFTIVRGNGKRKLAVFEDPNCGYCKRFETDLLNINNVTVYMFLYPILGPASVERSKNIWCAKDRAKAWNDWMVKNVDVPAATCDTAPVTRNVEFGKKYKITGTPTLVFTDGQRVPGAIPATQVEKFLAEVK